MTHFPPPSPSTPPLVGQPRAVTAAATDRLRTPGSTPWPLRAAAPVRVLVLWLAALGVMAPLPLAGAWLLQSQFDRPSEAFMMLGGVTLFPSMLLLLVMTPSEQEWIGVMVAVWAAAALAPGLWFGRRPMSWWGIALLLGLQAAFSIAQAVMGALLIIGKSV